MILHNIISALYNKNVIRCHIMTDVQAYVCNSYNHLFLVKAIRFIKVKLILLNVLYI